MDPIPGFILFWWNTSVIVSMSLSLFMSRNLKRGDAEGGVTRGETGVVCWRAWMVQPALPGGAIDGDGNQKK